MALGCGRVHGGKVQVPSVLCGGQVLQMSGVREMADVCNRNHVIVSCLFYFNKVKDVYRGIFRFRISFLYV